MGTPCAIRASAEMLRVPASLLSTEKILLLGVLASASYVDLLNNKANNSYRFSLQPKFDGQRGPGLSSVGGLAAIQLPQNNQVQGFFLRHLLR